MLWKSSFQITNQTLEDLKLAGLDTGLLSALRNRVTDRPLPRRDFEDLLDRLENRALQPRDRKLIRKYAQLSLLRLERIIPNRSVREWTDAFIYAVLIALLVRTFLIAPFKIPSGSMYPTIKEGDHIFATRFTYGLPVPFTDIKLVRSRVERGDIVIFPYPRNPDDDYIKRVVGLGGETVEMRESRVFIDGKPLDEPYAYHDPQVVEALRRSGQSLPSFDPLRVPEGKLFVMGDNRFNSSDSRVWGFVEEKSIKGQGWVVFFSHDPRSGMFSGYRLGRIGSTLE